MENFKTVIINQIKNFLTSIYSLYQDEITGILNDIENNNFESFHVFVEKYYHDVFYSDDLKIFVSDLVSKNLIANTFLEQVGLNEPIFNAASIPPIIEISSRPIKVLPNTINGINNSSQLNPLSKTLPAEIIYLQNVSNEVSPEINVQETVEITPTSSEEIVAEVPIDAPSNEVPFTEAPVDVQSEEVIPIDSTPSVPVYPEVIPNEMVDDAIAPSIEVNQESINNQEYVTPFEQVPFMETPVNVQSEEVIPIDSTPSVPVYPEVTPSEMVDATPSIEVNQENVSNQEYATPFDQIPFTEAPVNVQSDEVIPVENTPSAPLYSEVTPEVVEVTPQISNDNYTEIEVPETPLNNNVNDNIEVPFANQTGMFVPEKEEKVEETPIETETPTPLNNINETEVEEEKKPVVNEPVIGFSEVQVDELPKLETPLNESVIENEDTPPVMPIPIYTSNETPMEETNLKEEPTTPIYSPPTETSPLLKSIDIDAKPELPVYDAEAEERREQERREREQKEKEEIERNAKEEYKRTIIESQLHYLENASSYIQNLEDETPEEIYNSLLILNDIRYIYHCISKLSLETLNKLLPYIEENIKENKKNAINIFIDEAIKRTLHSRPNDELEDSHEGYSRKRSAA